MFRSLIVFGVLVLGGLFAYYYFTDSSARSGEQKAKSALERVGDTVADRTAASAVRAKLAADFGMDTARFLHVHFDEGTALVYGLVPPSLQSESIRQKLVGIPGVKTVIVRVLPQPSEISTATGTTASPVE